MGFRSWLAKKIYNDSLDARSGWLYDRLTGGKVDAGVSVNQNTAWNMAAVYASINIISQTVGSLPVGVFKKLPRGKESTPKHRLYRLIHNEPNPDMSAMTFYQTMQATCLGWGNAYAEIVRDRNTVARELWPLDSAIVTPKLDDNNKLYYEVQDPTNGVRSILPRNIIHIKDMGRNGYVGESRITRARQTIGLGIAAEKFGSTFFGNGAHTSGVLTHPTTLGDDAQRRLKKQLDDKLSGDNQNSTLVLEEDMKWLPISVPPDDAQFLETRRFQVEEIARWFNVPPHKIGHLEEVPKHTIEQQNIEWVVDTIRPWLVNWEQELNRKLFHPSESDIFIEFNVEGLLRGDIAARREYFKDAITFSWMTPNEVKEKESMNVSDQPGMDDYYMQANMVKVGTEPAEQPEPTEQDNDDDTMENFLRAAGSRVANREFESFKKNTKDKSGPEIDEWLNEYFAKHLDYVMSAIPISEENAKEYIDLGREHILNRNMDNWTETRVNELVRLAQ